MTEKVCQLYEEEQIGKVREGRKAVPNSKMPNLGWDITETQLQETESSEEIQEVSGTNTPQTAIPLQAMVTIAILLITLLELLNSYVQGIPKIIKRIVRTVKSIATRISNTKVIRNVKKTYRETEQKIIIATRVIDHINHDSHHS